MPNFELDLSSSSSSDDDFSSNFWNHDDEYELADYQPRKKRRTQRNSKEKSALGVFGSESEDDYGPGKKWKRNDLLRGKRVNFISTTENETFKRENESSISGEDNHKHPNFLGLNQSSVDSDNSLQRNFNISMANSSKSFITGSSAKRSIISDQLNNQSTKTSSSNINHKIDLSINASVNSRGSFAARMMTKMGYKEGEGLGKEGQGRNTVIEVTLRPQGVGLGAIREKSKQEIEEEKRQAKTRGTKLLSKDERSGTQKKSKFSLDQHGEKGMTDKQKQTLKIEYTTISEVQNAAPGLKVPDSFVKILDMTAPGQRTLTSLTEALSNSSESESKEKSEIRKLVSCAKKDLFFYAEEWKHLEEKKAYVKLKLTQQRKDVREVQQRLDNMHQLASKLHLFSQPVEDIKLDNIIEIFNDSSFTTDLELSNNSEDVSKIVVAAVHPLLRQSVKDWKPLEDPNLGGIVSQLLSLSKVLGVLGDKNLTISGNSLEEFNHTQIKSSTAYESMIFKIVYPKILNSIDQEWDVYEPIALQTLLDVWQDLLPSFLRSMILNQTVVRKLNMAVSSWNPKKRKSHKLPHLWLFPWLQYLPVYHTDPQSSSGLVSNIKRKFRQLVDSWDFHKGVVPGLHQWRDVLYVSSKNDQWTPLIMNHVLPSMSKFLRNENNFMVNPNDQAPFMSSLNGIFEWQNVVKSQTVAQVIVNTVFPLWHNVLHQWLTVTGPNEEIGLWFEWWRNDVFPNEIKNLKMIQNEFDKGHEMIKQALDLGPNFSELLHVPVLNDQSQDTPVNQDSLSILKGSEENTFRNRVKDWCVENDLQFLSEKKTFHPSGPLHRITAAASGKNGVLVSIKGDRIWALSKKGLEYIEIEITWESTDAKDLLLGLAWHNVK